MNCYLIHNLKKINGKIRVSGSKSESNRLLILQQLYPNISIKNSSDADDTLCLQQALLSGDAIVDVGHAGTAMRFLTAFFAFQTKREVTLRGSKRMHDRPIKILVDALKALGANISYLEKEGYPPLFIKGTNPKGNTVTVNGSVSSQYISALLLIGAKLPAGLVIKLNGNITSLPYINMTVKLLQRVGVNTVFNDRQIEVFPLQKAEDQTFIVESDWSSASYWYALIALSEVGASVTLSSYNKESLQGDRILAEIYVQFGVQTYFGDHQIVLKKQSKPKIKKFIFDFTKTPDIAQTLAVTCLGLQIRCDFTGLHTLKIKETDRLQALKNELQKFGAIVTITDNSLFLIPPVQLKKDVIITTYNDHRMAMAFASLINVTSLTIENANVVTKSYPTFWKDLKKLGLPIVLK